MAWPVPAPGEISSRAAAIFEQMLPGIDARSDNTGAAAITRVTELAAQDLYYEQGYLAQQLLPDTATDWLARHAQIWGVPRDQPTFAKGSIIVSGAPGADLPAQTLFTTQTTPPVQYESTQAVTLQTNASVPLQAVVAGSGGNLSSGATLYPVSPVLDLTPQRGVVDASGITGGLDLESVDSWRSRLLAKIRTEPSGGSVADYIQWAKAALPDVAYAALPPALQVDAAVVVVVAMRGPAVPSAGEIAEIQAYIDTMRPVTAQVTVIAATLQPVNISIQVRPDTTAIEKAATAAIDFFFSQLPADGGAIDIASTLYLSDLSAAVSGADGEQYHELLAPTADVAPASAISLLTLGTVTFS